MLPDAQKTHEKPHSYGQLFWKYSKFTVWWLLTEYRREKLFESVFNTIDLKKAISMDKYRYYETKIVVRGGFRRPISLGGSTDEQYICSTIIFTVAGELITC